MVLVQNLNKEITLKKEKIKILKNINFRCPSKGFVLIYGISGCGKTTLLNILEGLDEKYTGIVEIFGQNLKKYNKSRYLSNDIRIIFQESNFINNFSVLDNIKIIENIRKYKINYADLENKLSEFNIKNIYNKKIEMLSGGERQILSIVLTYFLNFKILFCDEPTGSIDEHSELILVKLLKDISKNKLVIAVSHNIDLYKNYSDKIIHIKDGEIIE